MNFSIRKARNALHSALILTYIFRKVLFSVPKGDSIWLTSDKDGKIYLVRANTTPDRILNYLRVRDVIAGNPVSFATSTLTAGKDYWLYAVDVYGIHSDAYPLRVDFGINIEGNSKDEVKIYPNPANDIITLQRNGTGIYSLMIYKSNGQLVLKKNFSGKYCRIDISGFQKGVYFIAIRSKDLIRTEKIIKL